jgi:type VI secretion system protein ImpK
MSDNPFSEPDDPDRTVIRPAPGGRRAAPSRPPEPAATEAPPAFRGAPLGPTAEGPETIVSGQTPLLAAAAPLLQLLARLRNTYSQPDPAELHGRAVRQIRAFEAEARQAGVPPDQIRPAHYALCASLDDVVLNTPWGSAGAWAQRSLVSTFHQEVQSGERFFDMLAKLRESPGTFLPVLELMYLCISLGFQGRYRLSPRGPGELERLREDLYTVITRQRGQAAEPALSPHWQGVAVPYRPARAVVPTWVVGAGVLAILGGLFVWFSTGLNAASDASFQRMLKAPPGHMPAISRTAPVHPPAPAPAATVADPLATFLKPEIDAGLVQVLGEPSMPIVRIRNAGMFGSGRADVSARYLPLLRRIGEALKTERGPVTVIGYTDNQPIHTIRFPSNFQLSSSRAAAAREIIVRALGNPGRVTAEGRGDADPIASNATAQGRDENRRIEVVLKRQG